MLTAAIALFFTALVAFDPSASSARLVGPDGDMNAPMASPFPPPPPVRGQAGDLWADVIIGKPDFSQIGPYEVVPFKVFNPGGVVVDRSTDPGRAYVWDSGNSRILGLDLAACYARPSPCVADIVIGQPSGYHHSACNGDSGVQNFPARPLASAQTLCGLPDVTRSPAEHPSFVTMAVDSNANLYVPDSFNNRVLKYNSPFDTDTIADAVWGQDSFSGIMCNQGAIGSPRADTLCFHSHSNRYEPGWYGNGTEIDPAGNLWVADSGNNRVLRFPIDPTSGTIRKTADLVLGQADFTTSKPGHESTKMHTPSAIRFAPDGKAFVIDTDNNRLLEFHPPFATGMPATRVHDTQFRNPTSLEIDPHGRGIWIYDNEHAIVALWDTSITTLRTVLGKTAYDPSNDCGSHAHHGATAWTGPFCHSGGGIGIDHHGNVLVAARNYDLEGVIRFSVPSTPEPSAPIPFPDKNLFNPPSGSNFMGWQGLRTVQGIVTWGNQMIVSDIYRLMYWDDRTTLTNGQAANGVVGDLHSRDTGDHCCGIIKADIAGRLWVLGLEGRGPIDIYQLPLTETSVPIHTIPIHERSFPVLGSDHRITFRDRIFGIAPGIDGTSIWISDTDNHRVLRIRNPLTNPMIDVILGQHNATGTLCNRRAPAAAHVPHDLAIHDNITLDMLCFPGSLSLDNFGNLYVSDHSLEIEGNQRLLAFANTTFPPEPSSALYAPSAAKSFDTYGASIPNLGADDYEYHSVIDRPQVDPMRAATFRPTFDSTNRMVVGYNMYAGYKLNAGGRFPGGRFVGVYDDPLGPNTQPTGYLYDFASMPFSATFDADDNLYIGDINRGRVLIYYNPFNGMGSAPSDPSESKVLPTPEYPIDIASVDPIFPNCVLAWPVSQYQTHLELLVNGFAPNDGALLEFRKIGSGRWHRMGTGSVQTNQDASLITIRGFGFRKYTWPGQERLVMTVRFVTTEGEPLSNWSPAFVVADDVTSCGAAILGSSASGRPVPPAGRVASTTLSTRVKRSSFSVPAVHLAHNIPDLQVTTSDQEISCDFLAHYESTGAVTRWGHAISEVFEERPGVLTQYYQRGVVDCQQRHGVWRIERRLVWDYVGGGLAGSPDLGVEPDLISEQPGAVHGPFGHRVSNLSVDGTDIGFLDFFEANGGVAAFGYPKTDARHDTHPQAVLGIPGASPGFIRQYFQAAVLEFHPGSRQPVKLRLLGDVVRDRLYPDGSYVAYSSFGPMPPLATNQSYVPESINRS